MGNQKTARESVSILQSFCGPVKAQRVVISNVVKAKAPKEYLLVKEGKSRSKTNGVGTLTGNLAGFFPVTVLGWLSDLYLGDIG